MPDKILIVEDEDKLAAILEDYLTLSDFTVSRVADGLSVMPLVRKEMPDLILLDLMLPGKNGLDVCKEIRTFSSVPIIMVTARIEEIDRLLGLELGADDYICKPFSPREVVARVKTVLRRAGGHQGSAPPGLVLDDDGYRATLQGRDLDLTAVEFKLLQIMVRNPGRIFNRTHLMDRIYPDQRVVDDRTIDSHIKKLRRKIEAVEPDADIIRSVYGVGYKYENP